MPKTIVIKVPNEFDLSKLWASLGSHVSSFRVLDQTETLVVSDATPPKNGRKGSRQGSRKSGISVVSSIMDHYTPQGIFTATHAQSWVHQNKYDINSASPALTALKKGGFIEQVAQGKYRFVRPLAPGTDVRAVVSGK